MAKTKVKERYQLVKRGTTPKGGIVNLEDIKINIPTVKIRLNEPKVSIEVDFSSEFDKGRLVKERKKITCYQSQLANTFALYEKQGKNPKVL